MIPASRPYSVQAPGDAPKRVVYRVFASGGVPRPRIDHPWVLIFDGALHDVVGALRQWLQERQASPWWPHVWSATIERLHVDEDLALWYHRVYLWTFGQDGQLKRDKFTWAEWFDKTV